MEQHCSQQCNCQYAWANLTLGHLSQGTGWYLASWSCLCSAVLGHGGGCPSTALHRNDQLAKYHPVPWLRVSWHQVFRLPEGIHEVVLDSGWVCCEHFAVNICPAHSGGKKHIEKTKQRGRHPDDKFPALIGHHSGHQIYPNL